MSEKAVNLNNNSLASNATLNVNKNINFKKNKSMQNNLKLDSINTNTKQDLNSIDNEKLKVVAKQFEALFYQQLLKGSKMFDDDKDGLFKSSASDTYNDLYMKKIAENLSETGSLKIAEIIENQLKYNNTIP